MIYGLLLGILGYSDKDIQSGGNSLSEPKYTAISFAPVQGFIEKSRKLRDLFGSSLILSYLSQQLAQAAEQPPDRTVISPALLNVQEGMPNRILIRGLFERNDVEKTLIQAWTNILDLCREWVEQNVPAEYHWEPEWFRWRQYAWEIFWGQGTSAESAMLDLERRKLKRDWTGINWIGESSSLSGTDAIAWPRLAEINSNPSRSFNSSEKAELAQFYRQLAWVLDDPYQRARKTVPDGFEPEGKYVATNERLSIPELVKRLVTLPKLARELGLVELEEGFKDVVRESGCWTGWFMGDGDKVGDALKHMTNDQQRCDFSKSMRDWGETFKQTFPEQLGRVVYAGGDDFLGVLYSDNVKQKLQTAKALSWLMQINQQWQQRGQDITLSLGFVWAGHSVPQRDVLQHCREAEKRSKSLGRDRVTIRVVFNSGQYVQWTCPWGYLDILTKYRDRNEETGNKANWSHLYNDWATLKSRHVIVLKDCSNQVDDYVALKIFELYFDDMERFEQHSQEIFKKDYTPKAVINWLDGLVNVGWQLCSNS